ncbi:hypothetical protein PENSPDRAFT_684748 [Peniophora sp. CONT]|nr:hypothetical protein PENSPDRAFT_684748 [Peniophora sp. CONT]
MSNSFYHNHTSRPPERPSSQASRASSRPGSANQARPAPRVTWFGQGPRAPYSLTSTPAPGSSRIPASSFSHADARMDDLARMPPPANVPTQTGSAHTAGLHRPSNSQATSNSWLTAGNWTQLSEPWQPEQDARLMGEVGPLTAQLSEIRRSDRPRSSITAHRPLDPSISPLDTTPTPPTALEVINTQDRERAARAQEQRHNAQPSTSAPASRRPWPSPEEQAMIDRALHPAPTRDSSEPASDPLRASFVQQTDAVDIPLDSDNLPIPEEGRPWGSLETLRGIYIISNNNPFIHSGEAREAAFQTAYNIFNRARPGKRSFEAFKRHMDRCLSMKLLESDPDNAVLRKKAKGVKMSEGHRQPGMVRLEKIAGERERYMKLSADQKEAQAEEDTKKKKAGEAMKRQACRTAGSKRSAREALASELEDSDSDSDSESDGDSDDVPAQRKGKGKGKAPARQSASRRAPQTPHRRTGATVISPRASRPTSHTSPRRRRIRSVSKSPRSRRRPRPTKRRRVTQSTDHVTDILEDSISKASEDRRRLEGLLRDTSNKQQATVDKLVGSLNDLSTALINGALRDSHQQPAPSRTSTSGRVSSHRRGRTESNTDVDMRTPSPLPSRVEPPPTQHMVSPSPTRWLRDSADRFFAPSRFPSTSPARAPVFDLESSASPVNLQPSRSQARPSADMHLDMLASRGRAAPRTPSPALGVPSSSRRQISSQVPFDDASRSPSRSSSFSPSFPSTPVQPTSPASDHDATPDLRAFLIRHHGEDGAREILHRYWSEEKDVG